MPLATPTAAGAIAATSQAAATANGNYVFQFGVLPPQASATLVVTLTATAAVDVPTDLLAATGWASLAGRAVSAIAAPVVVLPPDFSQWCAGCWT